MKGKNQLLTGMKGSFENLTVTKYHDGDSIVKGKITEMTNPNTTEQQFTRTRFKAVVAAARSAYLPPRGLFIRNKPLIVLWNGMVSRGMELALQTDPYVDTDFRRDFDFWAGSNYPVAPTIDVPNIDSSDPQVTNVPVLWSFNASNPSEVGTDLIYAFFINSIEDSAGIIDTNNSRADESAAFDIPRPNQGTNFFKIYAVSIATGETSSQATLGYVSTDGSVTVL